MKIAIASTERNLEANVSSIFGRGSAFIFANVDKEKVENIDIIENTAKNKSGAGNVAAQLLIDHGVNVLISGKLGPVAFHILKNAGIRVYKAGPGSVKDNLKRFNEDRLEEIKSLSGGFPA